LVTVASAATLSSSGNWSRTIDSSDLVGGAGSALNSQYQSASAATTLDVSGALLSSWNVTARIATGTWNGNFHLSVKRTSNGSGLGSISGGTSFTELTSVDTQIFSGSLNRSGITIQYQLTGVSVTVAPNTYSSSVIYTITP
jgi:hypothetical protein